LVHELDTTDLNKWTENILEKSTAVFGDYLERFEKDCEANLNLKNESTKCSNEEIHVHNKCEICDRIFINKSQWTGK
jgi:hypothetical protein